MNPGHPQGPEWVSPLPGTQKASLPGAGVSCWAEGAGSAKDRFGGAGPQELEWGGGDCVKEGESEEGTRY